MPECGFKAYVMCQLDVYLQLVHLIWDGGCNEGIGREMRRSGSHYDWNVAQIGKRSVIYLAEGMWCEREWDLEIREGGSGGANRDMTCSGGGVCSVCNGSMKREVNISEIRVTRRGAIGESEPQ